MLLLRLSLIVLTLNFALAKNILGLFPHYGYSHFKVFHPIMMELAKRGHNVTVVAYIKNPEPHSNYEEFILEVEHTVNVFTLDRFTPNRSLWDIINEYFILHDEGQEACEKFYSSGYVEKILERHKTTPYDLVITEFFNTDCYLGVPYMLQLPVVGLSSCIPMPWFYDRILLPDAPSHVQTEFVGFPELLNWQQRLLNFVQLHANKILYRYHTNYYDNKVIKKYLHVDVDVDAFAKTSTSLFLVNQHYSISGNRPMTPQLIEIGGVHLDEANIRDKFSKEIEDFLQSAQHGVILISWGSLLRSSTMDTDKLHAIIKVLQTLPLKVIWKWEDNEKPIESDQFLFLKWVPQLNILCHPKVKYFWGHGGLLGTTEAVYCAKPLLVTPVYGDQFCNGNAVQNRKVGLLVHYNDIDVKHLSGVLHEIMRPRFTENMQALSKVFRNRQTTPLETAIWWIEHILEHGKAGSKLLQTRAVELNWIVYYSLDTIFILLLTTILSVYLLKTVIQLTFFRHDRRDKMKND